MADGGDEDDGEAGIVESLGAARDAGGGPGAPDDGAPDAGPCPVQAIGRNGKHRFYLSPAGELWTLSAAEHTELNILALFEARQDWLLRKWPYVKDGEVKGWSYKAAAATLLRWAAEAGRLDISKELRGAGVWRDDDEVGLVVHAGDKVGFLEVEADGSSRYVWRRPGRYGGNVYAETDTQPRPARVPARTEDVLDVLDLLGTWNWSRPQVDPVLMLGWIACSILCGALDWRPSLWITANTGAGKSSLLSLMHNLQGQTALKLADTTEAALRQLLGGSAIPVVLDEFEPAETDMAAQEVLKIIRLSATRGGGDVGRGSAGGKGHKFALHAVFLCGSVLVPALRPADMQRLTILSLGTLEAEAGAFARVRRRIRDAKGLAGPLRRRLLDQWSRFDVTLDAYQRALREQGHSQRAADQLGTLLAGADMLMNDHVPPGPQIEALIAELAPGSLADRDDAREDWEQCLSKLLTSSLDAWRSGTQHTVGEAIVRVHAERGNPHSEWKHHLGRTGMKFEFRKNLDAPHGWYLIVSNNHDGLAKLFRGTSWGSSSVGQGRTGVWRQSLLRAPGAVICPNTERFAGPGSKAIALPAATLNLDYDAFVVDRADEGGM